MIKTIQIETAANGYIAYEPHAARNYEVFTSDQRHVFETFDALELAARAIGEIRSGANEFMSIKSAPNGHISYCINCVHCVRDLNAEGTGHTHYCDRREPEPDLVTGGLVTTRTPCAAEREAKGAVCCGRDARHFKAKEPCAVFPR